MLLARPLIEVAYMRGSFSPEAAALTTSAFFFLIIGLITNSISSILGHATLAFQKTKAAVMVTIASQITAIALFYLLTPAMDVAGLALASALVPLSSALLYFVYLKRFVPSLWLAFKHPMFARTIFITFVMSIVVIITHSLTLNTNAYLQLFLPTILGGTVFLTGAYLWKIEEMQTVTDLAFGKIKKWTGAKHQSK
jgi:putative peptidoglycan lipid II flippase